MKKKRTIIYAVVGAVVVLGFVISRFVDWPIDKDNASGNIAKSTHFSRKTADVGDTNMQELLLNDEDYKNGVVTAYLIMKTRAQQFNALGIMSFEVAGNIKEFESVLNDIQKAQPMVNNVCTSMDTAAKNLDAALGGENVEDLAQNTSNAALAYSTLQKQNSLATRFIETADEYLKSNAGDDRLKFVRDQWVEYQQMTAAMNQDKEAAAALDKKGYLLSSEKSEAALSSFSKLNQVSTLCNTSLTQLMGMRTPLHALELSEKLGLVAIDKVLKNAQNSELSNTDKALSNTQNLAALRNTDKALSNTQNSAALRNTDKALSNTQNVAALRNTQNTEALNIIAKNIIIMAVSGYDNLRLATENTTLNSALATQSDKIGIAINGLISAMAKGDMSKQNLIIE